MPLEVNMKNLRAYTCVVREIRLLAKRSARGHRPVLRVECRACLSDRQLSPARQQPHRGKHLRRFRTVSPSRRSELHRQRTPAQPATRACSSPRDRLACPCARDALSGLSSSASDQSTGKGCSFLDSFSGAGAALRRLHHSCRCFESLKSTLRSNVRFLFSSQVRFCFRVRSSSTFTGV